MTEREPFILHREHFHAEPAQFAQACKRVPITSAGLIPLGNLSSGFELKMPTFTDLGHGAVRMSVGRPFGFYDYNGISQLSDGLILVPTSDEPSEWQAILSTEEPLTDLDRTIVDAGIMHYAVQAERKLRARQKPRSFFARHFRKEQTCIAPQ